MIVAWPEDPTPIKETYTYFYYGTDPKPIIRNYRIDHLVKEVVMDGSIIDALSYDYDHIYDNRRQSKVLTCEFVAQLVRPFGVRIKDEDDGTE